MQRLALKGYDVDKNAVFEAAKASAMLDERHKVNICMEAEAFVTGTEEVVREHPA